ncbi:glycosyltransferase [Echria macrotheca]|uniref:Alpha-1,3/1,6-mannosyltransferase ALG2 n=1 Tax=Echria macrotheca TaxID=438768 RepID=A0AAJ0BQH2_9PEZI|nr:glycosyltransferase [Echria macrotheca]
MSTKNTGAGDKSKSEEKEEQQQQQREKKKTIVFLHPDLGIGGAERLVVDAAGGLQRRGHRVVIFTSHCDPGHCFDEARDGTLDVRVRGDWLIPPSLFGRFAILCAILRQVHLILSICLFSGEAAELGGGGGGGEGGDAVFFVDQLSAGLPLLRLFLPEVALFFYCHFPDLLLARGREGLLKRAYRAPFDALERWSMGAADGVAVNSAFTRGVVRRTWPGFGRKKLHVVYPAIDTTLANEGEEERLKWPKPILLSINRFERKKDVALAIRAFALLPGEKRRATLVVAGGYDNRVPENVGYHAELVALADRLGLRNATASTVVSALSAAHHEVDVLFLLSVPGKLKDMLLRSARLVVYTPSGEHFGIVPLEAMLRGVPVLAADDGGPTETVVDGETGWLRDPKDTEAWAAVMEMVLEEGNDKKWEEMGRRGRERVVSRFAVGEMAERLDGIFEGMVQDKKKESEGRRKGTGLGDVLLLGVAMAIVVGMVSMVVGGARILRDLQPS